MVRVQRVGLLSKISSRRQAFLTLLVCLPFLSSMMHVTTHSTSIQVSVSLGVHHYKAISGKSRQLASFFPKVTLLLKTFNRLQRLLCCSQYKFVCALRLLHFVVSLYWGSINTANFQQQQQPSSLRPFEPDAAHITCSTNIFRTLIFANVSRC